MSVASTAPPAGVILAGKYRVEALIGAGGVGWVLAARHVELDTPVAIKVLRADVVDSAEHRERFRREAKVVASLQSEHVARVFDFGTLEDGALYVAMELLQGRDLDEELKVRGPLPIEETVGHFLGACEGLAEAHARGVVHRDLKPKNLFLVRRMDGRRLLKVLDFGIAKKGSALGEDSLTRINDVLGTPRYMAPEQLKSAKVIDERADIWALGVALYEALTGKAPFDGANDVIVFSAILQLNAPRIRSLRADIPQGLDDVVHRCLAKDPDQRFQSILELAVALEPFGPPGLGTAKRIHAILSRDGEKLLPLPLARMSHHPSAPSIRTIVWRGRRVASFSRGVRWAIGLGAAASVVVLAILFATAGGEEQVPPATAADPHGDGSIRGAEPGR